MPATNNGRRGKPFDITQVAISVVLAANTGLVGWIGVSTVSNAKSIASVEANRFTSQDALNFQKAMSAELLAIWQAISDVKSEMAGKADRNNVPPPEVIRWLERIENRLDELQGLKNG